MFKFASADYDANSDVARAFFAKTQDKFLYATTGRTSAEIILDRADHEEPAMGLQTTAGPRPARADVTVGKNYLGRDELYLLHGLSEMFLLFIETAAMRGLRLTMEQISAKFDELLAVQGYEVMRGYRLGHSRERANQHAYEQWSLYRARIAHSPQGAR